jgi:hypothetical protein
LFIGLLPLFLRLGLLGRVARRSPAATLPRRIARSSRQSESREGGEALPPARRLGYGAPMPGFDVHALWPYRDRVPLPRVAAALVAAPGLLALLLGLAAFLVMGMTETTGEAVFRETIRSAGALALLVYGFTFSFGLLGIALLWARAQRGLLAWALTGAVTGALAGLLFGLVAMSGVRGALVIAFALGGWAVFLLIRRIAGVAEVGRSG